MEIRIKNQLHGTVEFCIGMQEHTLEHDQDVIVQVSDGDCMYLDQLTFPKTKVKSPAALALADIAQAMESHKAGTITRMESLTAIGLAVSKYFDEIPVFYFLTDKAGVSDG